MGRELQKKKRRSSIPKVKHKPKSKRINNPRGNEIIAANWYCPLNYPESHAQVHINHWKFGRLRQCRDPKETLSQNYRRLGLTSRLNTSTGGREKNPTPSFPHSISAGKEPSIKRDRLSISNATPKIFEPSEAKIERDPETGRILRVIHSQSVEVNSRRNPLGDLLNSDDDSEEYGGIEDDDAEEQQAQQEGRGVTRQLEDQAARAAPRKEREQSEREMEWIQRLVDRWRDDYAMMARDRKLNPMQQTKRDIRRRVKIWEQGGRRG